MNLAKWRIRKSRSDDKWCVHKPGKRFMSVGRFDTFADAVLFLPTAQRWANRGFR